MQLQLRANTQNNAKKLFVDQAYRSGILFNISLSTP